MTTYTQKHRLMQVTTPLAPDALLLTGFSGREGISQLFRFQLDLLAQNKTQIHFDKLIGQRATIRINFYADQQRYFNGIINRFSQSGRDEVFTHYHADVVPQFWLWTRKKQSRIFQHLNVPDILKQVLTGLSVSWQIVDTYQPRDYCVQYRETDFAFASRLMEEEGIHYYFKHGDGSHEMVVTDMALRHPDVPAPSSVAYTEHSGGPGGKEPRVYAWEKTQELRSGKYTLWDHCFELPGKHLEAERPIAESVAVGRVTHELKVGGNDKLEIYDYPGGYAQRFDGVNKGGAPQPAEVQKIFEDNKRTVRLRMEEETVGSIGIQGASRCGQFSAGQQFTLKNHFDADGPYLLTSVDHAARMSGNYRSGADLVVEYENQFTAIPEALPYRPSRVTPKPSIGGTQTATVVGFPGQEVLVDKFGRIKVQFHWDRQGKKNGDSSCWIRVGQVNAGMGFGSLDLPRIGHEVIVAFQEGDPDQPVIVGVVYNADNMPPYKLPDQHTFSGVVHRSHQGVAKNGSEIRFQNQLGSELLLVHAETDSLQQTENNHRMQVGKVHRHEVGQFYHIVVGKPVNVNQVVVGLQAAPGSGAGGRGPSGPPQTETVALPGVGMDEQENTSYLSDGTEVDNYYGPGLETDIDGHNRTKITGNDDYSCGGSTSAEIGGDNHTNIHGDDHYWAGGFQYSVVDGAIVSYETNLLDIVLEYKMEFSGMTHVDHAIIKANGKLFGTDASPFQLFTLG